MSNGGILDLMMRYLKAVGQKFLEEWPRGLTAVVLEVYQMWRKHSSGLPNPLLRDCSNQHIRVKDYRELLISAPGSCQGAETSSCRKNQLNFNFNVFLWCWANEKTGSD